MDIYIHINLKLYSYHPIAVIGEGIMVVIQFQIRMLEEAKRQAEGDIQDLLNNIENSVS